MTLSVKIPGLTGALTGTSLTLDAAEDALAIGTKRLGALAQVSGAAAGFNLFTPVTNATYKLLVRGRDVATGVPTNEFEDVVEFNAVTGWAPVATAQNLTGTPGARTYTNNTGALKIAIASGTTWYVDVLVNRQPA